MKSMIARKQKKNANCYKVICGRSDFRPNRILKGSERQRITNNPDDPIYSIVLDKTKYVVKQIGHYDEDEFDIITKMITKNYVCPYMVEYYCCVKSMSNHKKYVVMAQANMDLKDFLRKYKFEATRSFLIDIVNFCLDLQLWCVEHLKMVYTDLKCRNLLVFLKNSEDEIKTMDSTEFDLRITDIGLMEYEDEIYKVDKKMLASDEIVNFMYPRRSCSYHQCALFTICMLIIEICVMHMKADDSASGGSNGGSNDSTTDSKDEDEKPMGFINLLDGRKTDDKILPLLSHIPMLVENGDISDFLSNLVAFRYNTIDEAKRDFVEKIKKVDGN